MTRSKDLISWHHDLVALLLANGFELGYTGETAWRTGNQGVLWAVAHVKNRALWYRYSNSLDRPSDSTGEMSRSTFDKLFVTEVE